MRLVGSIIKLAQHVICIANTEAHYMIEKVGVSDTHISYDFFLNISK